MAEYNNGRYDENFSLEWIDLHACMHENRTNPKIFDFVVFKEFDDDDLFSMSTDKFNIREFKKCLDQFLVRYENWKIKL